MVPQSQQERAEVAPPCIIGERICFTSEFVHVAVSHHHEQRSSQSSPSQHFRLRSHIAISSIACASPEILPLDCAGVAAERYSVAVTSDGSTRNLPKVGPTATPTPIQNPPRIGQIPTISRPQTNPGSIQKSTQNRPHLDPIFVSPTTQQHPPTSRPSEKNSVHQTCRNIAALGTLRGSALGRLYKRFDRGCRRRAARRPK